MMYASEDFIHVKLKENYPDEYKRLIKKCSDVIITWPNELHDTKDVSLKVLDSLGDHLISKLESLFPKYDERFGERYCDDTGYRIYLHKQGRDLTRQLKYLIKGILDIIYEKNPDFKYLKKYNPDNRQYAVWKNSKFKSVSKNIRNNVEPETGNPRYLSFDELKAYIEKHYGGGLIVEFKNNIEKGLFFQKIYKLIKVNNHPSIKYKLWLDTFTFKYADIHIADMMITHFSGNDIEVQRVDKELDEFFERNGKYSVIKLKESQDHIKDNIELLKYSQLKMVESIVNLLVNDNDNENLNYLINKLGSKWNGNSY